jgi:hypothetical protein
MSQDRCRIDLFQQHYLAVFLPLLALNSACEQDSAGHAHEPDTSVNRQRLSNLD